MYSTDDRCVTDDRKLHCVLCCMHACLLALREQKWFVDTVKAHGAPVSDYYAWEVTEIPPKTVWADIPTDMHATYHW
jgi:hypothetical protein